MKNYSLFRTDSGSGNFPPPPPPPPSYNPPPPPVSPNTGNTGGASSNAVITLVLGILSYIGCSIFTAIPAWIMGKKEINEINAGRAPEAGRTLATIGMWLGIVHVILAILGIIVFGILFFLGVLGSMFNQ